MNFKNKYYKSKSKCYKIKFHLRKFTQETHIIYLVDLDKFRSFKLISSIIKG